MQTIRRRKAIGRTIKSLRSSNRTRPSQPSNVLRGLSESPMPASDLPSSLADSDDDNDVFSSEFRVFGQPETVCVDVSGCCYTRQSRLRSSSTSATLCRSVPRLLTKDEGDDVAAEHRRLSSWRRTIGDVDDAKPRRQLMVFGPVDVDRSTLFRGLATKKSTSSRRSLVAAGDGGGRMTSSLQIYRPKAPAGYKSGDVRVDNGWRAPAEVRSSCSWRLSLKSLLKGIVRTKSSVDLWATTTAQHWQNNGGDGTLTTGARKAPIKFRRANSLPRSLKAMKRRSGSPTGSRSKSVEDQLDSSDRSIEVSSFRPEVTSAGNRLGRSVSLSRCQYQVDGGTSHVGRPQSLEVHIVAVDEFGRPSSGAGPSTLTERRVHVSIPEQPWTKPFANVRLRQRTARVINSDRYQSSSGTARD